MSYRCEEMICDECDSNAEYIIHTSFEILQLCESCAIEYIMDNHIFSKTSQAEINHLCEKCKGGNRLHYHFDEYYKDINDIPYDEVCYHCAYKYGKKELKNYAEKI